jgi:hypothetical protein
MRLTDLIGNYDTPLMREAVRQFRTKAIMESKVPQAGPYWWLPTPDGKWILEKFYDSEYRGATGHDLLWDKYVIERLSVIWGKDTNKLRRSLRGHYTGLPRGRVNKVSNGWTVVHGDNAPVSSWKNQVIRAFVLTAQKDKVRFMKDDHETIIPGDPEAIQDALKVDLGLKGTFSMDFEDDDYDDY